MREFPDSTLEPKSFGRIIARSNVREEQVECLCYRRVRPAQLTFARSAPVPFRLINKARIRIAGKFSSFEGPPARDFLSVSLLHLYSLSNYVGEWKSTRTQPTTIITPRKNNHPCAHTRPCFCTHFEIFRARSGTALHTFSGGRPQWFIGILEVYSSCCC